LERSGYVGGTVAARAAKKIQPVGVEIFFAACYTLAAMAVANK